MIHEEDALGLQDGWLPCDKCAALFYAPGGGYRCYENEGGPHTFAGGDNRYYVTANDGSAPGLSDFNWCHKCGELYNIDFGIGPPNGVDCPAGGLHDSSGVAGSANYTLLTTAAPIFPQTWHMCEKCMALIYERYVASPCPGGGGHDPVEQYIAFQKYDRQPGGQARRER